VVNVAYEGTKVAKRGWRAAGIIVVSTLVLAGCGRGVDDYVREYEGGDVEVESCRKIGETVTEAGVYPADAQEGGDRVDDVWQCTIRERARSVARCYVEHESRVMTIVRGVKCSSYG
jgi:hypothetical protein